MGRLSRESRLAKLEALHGGPARHLAPGVILYDVRWQHEDHDCDEACVHVEWEEDTHPPKPWPVRCSCGTVNCPRMTGQTIFLPRKGAMAHGIPRPRHEPGDEDAEEEVGVDELRPLADLRDQVARLQTLRREG
jgi:hypothetical protein